MAPVLDIDDPSGNTILTFPATPTSFQRTTTTLTTTLRVVICLLAALTLIGGTLWILVRTRVRLRRLRRSNAYRSGYESVPGSARLILESSISIDMIPEDNESSGTEFEDLSGRSSMETILSSASATRITFDIEKIPGLMKGNILERRGRGKSLHCDTTAYYETNSVVAGSGALTGRKDHTRSVIRQVPVFGFNIQDITPPVGSPLWNRKTDIPRTVCPGPLTQPAKLS